MRLAAFAMVILLTWLPSTAGAENIYTWKDENGVLQFSDRKPPEGVTDYEIIESKVTPGSDPSPADERRDSFDRMVEEARAQSERLEAERKKEAAAREAEEKRKAEAARKARIEAERQRLEKEIEQIRNRAVSITYPNGMKQAQIDALQKEIQKLEQGAATEASE